MKVIKRTKNLASCPICGQTHTVNSVRSSNNRGTKIVYRKYCKECLLEFDTYGIVQPLY